MNEKVSMFVKVVAITIVLTVVTELIGVKKLNIGIGLVALFPMLYAVILGGLISFPKFKLIKESESSLAGGIFSISLLIMVAKVGTTLGPSIATIAHEGWALIFQEIGHFLGTVVFALPIAVLMGMNREAIGATYSISREANLAIIAEKFGIDSDESRGAMGVYICGTLFGAIYMGLLASVLGSTGIFHPLALAMGAGVGSGSMMAAASGSLISIFPDYADQITVFAGAANMATGILGTFVCAFISLPLTIKVYEWMKPKVSKKAKGEK